MKPSNIGVVQSTRQEFCIKVEVLR